MTMRATPGMIVLTFALGLVFGVGCTRPDWIQQTLVTGDVTGTWAGGSTQMRGGYSDAFEAQLELQQEGSKVTGQFRLIGAGGGTLLLRSGPIDGSLAGDGFSFRQSGGPLVGEMTVSGDAMDGYIASGANRYPMSFKRVDSASRPDSR